MGLPIILSALAPAPTPPNSIKYAKFLLIINSKPNNPYPPNSLLSDEKSLLVKMAIKVNTNVMILLLA